MRYHVLHIETSFPEEWRKAVFDQMLCNIGVDTIDGEYYYLPSEIWEQKEKLIRVTIDVEYHMDKSAKLISVEACPDENWNATWEAEHPMQELPLGIKIIPHCAFGAGHHETTSMMIDSLLGAAQVIAVDIDEKSVENAKENAALNNEEIDVRLGDCVPEGQYDLILANIHRNVLLANMSAYAASLKEGGELWLSGFYESDIPILTEAANQQGLEVIQVLANGEWRMMKCQKSAPL